MKYLIKQKIFSLTDSFEIEDETGQVVITAKGKFFSISSSQTLFDQRGNELLKIKRKYRDRYEWRWYDDIYNKRITFPQEVLTRQYYLDLGLEIGRYGEYKALAGGTTSLQGGRINLAYSKEECLVRNIENSAREPKN